MHQRLRRLFRPQHDVEAALHGHLQPIREEIDKLWHSASHLGEIDRRARERAVLLERQTIELFTRANSRAHALEIQIDDVRRRTAGAIAHQSLGLTAWVDQLPPQPGRVSVLLATRNRCALLAQAIASVQAQTHADWELVVVDDGSTDGTPDLLASLEDPRIVTARVDHGSQPAALNAAAEIATGELIAYLDDDNLMHPRWLATVAWALSTFGDVDVVYGARVCEPEVDERAARLPALVFEPWSRRSQERRNLIDQNVLAHRAGLAAARLDETLSHGADWDLALRLTEDKDPLGLPVVAVLYRTVVEARLSRSPEASGFYRLIQRRAVERRGLRILAFRDEQRETLALVQELGRAGAHVTSCRDADDLERMIATSQPDALLAPSARAILDVMPILHRARLPFTFPGDAHHLAAHDLYLGAPGTADAGVVGELLTALERHHGLDAPFPQPAERFLATTP